MKITTFAAQCATCGSEFPYPEVSDFAYGEFIFSGEEGSVFALFSAPGHPVSEFVKAVMSQHASGMQARVEFSAVCARLAEPVAGQCLVAHRVCPVCRSSEWKYWRGERLGAVEVPEASFAAFLALSEAERSQAVLEATNKKERKA